MAQSRLPSQLLFSLLPSSMRHGLQQTVGGEGHEANSPLMRQVGKRLTQLDMLVAGRDENAQSMRMATMAFTVRIASAALAYLSQILIARWVGTHEYGLFVWVWTMVVILGGLAALGFPSSIVRFIPEYQVSGQNGHLRGVLFSFRIAAFGVATVVMGLSIALIMNLPQLTNSIYTIPLLLSLACLPMLALGEVQDGAARSFSWKNLALTPTFLIRPALVLICMAAALAAGAPATAVTALTAAIIATWVTTLWQMIMLNIRLQKTVPPEPRQFKPAHWVAVSLPILLVDSFFYLLTNVDILIAGLYLPPQQVAIYFAAVKTLALVHFVYFAIRAAASHRYAKFYNNGDEASLRNLIHKTVSWTFWPSLLLAIIMLVLGQYFLALFGPDFATAYPLMFILVIGIIARAAVGPAESLLNMVGQQKACALVCGATLSLNIVLNFTLIPVYGIYGAAIATTIAMVLETVALYATVWRQLNISMVIFAPAPQQSTQNIQSSSQGDRLHGSA